MRFRIDISCDNDAFIPDPSREVSYALQRIVARLGEADGGTIIDSNGNSVGSWGYHEEDDEELRPTSAIDADGDQWSLYPDGLWRSIGAPAEPSLASIMTKYGLKETHP